MTTIDDSKLIAHDLSSVSNIIRLIAKKYPASADGFEEFQVRGSALRHMGVSIEHMADQVDMAASAFCDGIPLAAASNIDLLSAIFEGCSFQLRHFGLSLKSDHHHMVPMCGAHNPRSPTSETGYLWAGIAGIFAGIGIHSRGLSTGLSDSFTTLSGELTTFADGLGLYREAMEESRFAKAAKHLENCSQLMGKVSKAAKSVSSELRKLR